MGVVSAVADAVVVLFCLTIVVAAPLIDGQSLLPHTLYPAPLRDLKRWYAAEFGDYLMAQPPAFLRGLFWLELAFLWPLAIATLYGVLAKRRWAATTSLIAGVTTLTSMVINSIFRALLRDLTRPLLRICETQRPTPRIHRRVAPGAMINSAI
jgi:hypothetical protein